LEALVDAIQIDLETIEFNMDVVDDIVGGMDMELAVNQALEDLH
jgi:hypothetical protein